MTPRAVWKGHLQVAELTCPVSLFTAVSSSDRIAFHTINRATGHRVHRQFVDDATGKPVPKEDQVKGYPGGEGDYIVLEPEEIAAAVPESDKVLAVKSFVACNAIDTVYFDRPYFLVPGDKVAEKAYGLIREGLSSAKVAALAQTVLFRRVRTALIRASDEGLMATLLNFDYEVRSAADAFDDIPDLTIKDEMLDLAEHIIKTKMGAFDPKTFDDRYETAVAEMVRAKIEGRPMEVRPAPKETKVVDLLAALRESAKTPGAAKSSSGQRGKAGSAETAVKQEAGRSKAARASATVQSKSRRKVG